MFTAPWAFLALLSLPALASLYWLRNSYRRVPVSSLMLWLEQAESQASGLRVKRLQTPLLFFLELAALALLALAATGPRLELFGSDEPLVVILDDSYSMQAGQEESAQNLAQKALERDLSWNTSREVRFILAGSFPQVLGEPVSGWTEANRLLAGWRCRSHQAKISQAITLAMELAGPQARILVLSDHGPRSPVPSDELKEKGSTPGKDPVELPPGNVEWWSFGRSRSNVALTQAHRTSLDDKERVSLEVANLAEEPGQVNLVLETHPAGQMVRQEKLNLAPRESRRVLLQLRGELPSLRVRLGSDALDMDNQAWLLGEVAPFLSVDVSIQDEPLKMLVKKALEATGKTKPAVENPHLLITDAGEIPPVRLETWVFQLVQEKEAEAYVGPFILDRAHPLTQGMDLGGVAWGAGKEATFAGVPVLLAGNVPLVTDVENVTSQHHVRFRLRPDLSTLPTSPAWPIFFYNLVTWRAAELPGLGRANLRLGESTTLKLPTRLDSVNVTSSGSSARSIPVYNQKVVITPGDIGVTEIQAGETTFYMSASALNREESDLSRGVTGRWGEWKEEPYSASLWYHIAWLLLLLTLAILTLHLFLAGRGAT